MTGYKGALVLLKIGDGQTPETFTTVGGMRTTRFILNNRLIDTTNKDSGAWREVLSGGGVRFISISGDGLFTDDGSEETLRVQAFDNSIKNYELCFGNGDKLSGSFQITSYERAGDYDAEETYSITLESSGEVVFTKG